MAPDALFETERRDSVLLITVDNRLVNALEVDVRQGLVATIEAAEGDTAEAVVLIVGAERNLIVGANIREFDNSTKPSLVRPSIGRNGKAIPPISSTSTVAPFPLAIPLALPGARLAGHVLIEGRRRGAKHAASPCASPAAWAL